MGLAAVEIGRIDETIGPQRCEPDVADPTMVDIFSREATIASAS